VYPFNERTIGFDYRGAATRALRESERSILEAAAFLNAGKTNATDGRFVLEYCRYYRYYLFVAMMKTTWIRAVRPVVHTIELRIKW
jgi:hypothetical protein